MFTENRAAFLVDFGDDVTIGSQPARVLWSDAYVEPLGVASTGPAALGFDVDLPPYVIGTTTLVREGVTYRITNAQPDGTGTTLLRLERQ
jgi:hypothetical protein